MIEILEIPEEYVEDVCKVITAGLRGTEGISSVARCALRKWVRDEREYLERLRKSEQATESWKDNWR